MSLLQPRGLAASVLLLAAALAALTPGPRLLAQTRARSSEELLRAAERELLDGNPQAAAASYSGFLLALLGELKGPLAPEERSRLIPEAYLALRRLGALAAQCLDARPALDALSAWAAAPEPDLAAFAAHGAGWLALRTRGDPGEARALWKPLGFLDGWRIAGPFDNERGGGFKTRYGPEEGIDLEARYDGKKHEVSWRKLPRRPLAGRVDLDALLLPNDQALAYALTFVRSARAQPAVLRLGSNEGYRAWVNGKLVGSEDVHRPLRFDQSALRVELQEGWNVVLLKVAEADGAWELRARLTGLDASALEGVEEAEPDAAALAGFRSVAAAQESAPQVEAVRRPVEDALRESIEKQPADARAHYLLGAILLELHAHDTSEHPDTELLRRATQLDSKTALYHYDLARSHLRETKIAAQRDDNAWRRAMERADELGSALAALRLAEHYEDTFQNSTRALELLDRALARNPACAEALVLRGRIEERLGTPLALRRAAGEALQAAPDSLAALTAQANVLEASGLQEERERLLCRLHESDRLSAQARNELSELLAARGAIDDARRLLEELRVLSPFATVTEAALGRLELGAGRPGSASSYYARALELRPQDHELLEKQGAALLEDGQRDAALEVWDRSLSLQPNQPRLREHLEFLRARESGFVASVRRDSAPLIAAAHTEKYGSTSGEPARVLLDLTAVEVHRDGTSREYQQEVVEILSDAGVRLWSRFSARYAVGEQLLEFKKARVVRPDGSAVEARLGRFGGDVRGDPDSSDVYSSGSVNLPPLSPGDIVEVELVREDLRQSFFGDYYGRREVFQGALACRERVFELRVPSERKFYFHQRQLEVSPERVDDAAAGTTTYTWVLKDVPRIDQEPGMPPLAEVAPVLEVSTFASWEEFATWYRNLIRKQFESSPDLDRKTAELVSGKQSEIDKIRAVYDFVANEVRYNAWEFGVHGFKPYKTSTVFSRRFGDCKDKSALLCVMLGQLGITAHPVIIHATPSRGEEDLSLPMVHHFNHCIAYLPAAGARTELYVDGTATMHRLEELPSMDRGARVLVVGDETGELRQVPWNDPEEVSLDEEWTVRLDRRLAAEVRVRLAVSGDLAVGVRQRFEIAARRREELEESYGRRYAGVTVAEESFSDLKNLNEPVRASFVLRVPRFAEGPPEAPELRIPDDFYDSVRVLGLLGSLEMRRYDVLLGVPRRSRLRVQVELPEGLVVKSLPSPREIATRSARFTLRCEEHAAERKIELEKLAEITAPRVALSEYEGFRALAAAVDDLRNEKIVLRAK